MERVLVVHAQNVFSAVVACSTVRTAYSMTMSKHTSKPPYNHSPELEARNASSDGLLAVEISHGFPRRKSLDGRVTEARSKVELRDGQPRVAPCMD